RSRPRGRRDPGPARGRDPCGDRGRCLGPRDRAAACARPGRGRGRVGGRLQHPAAGAVAHTARRAAGAGRRGAGRARRGRALAQQTRPGPARRPRLAAGVGMNTRAAAEALLFGDTLACEELRPATFLPRPRRNDPALAASGEALLRTLAVVEAGPRDEAPHSGGRALRPNETTAHMLRSMAAGWARVDYDDAVCSLRWSARGVCEVLVDAPPAGCSGLFRVRPADCLPSSLLLPATEIA